jgi:ceramide glucosyltransferase
MTKLVFIVQYAMVHWWLIGLFSWVFIFTMASYRSALRLPSPPAGPTPPVTIVVLASGIEPEFERNIASVLEQNYPDFRVLFSIADATDESRPTIEAAIQNNPGVSAQLDIGEVKNVADPQIRNYLTALKKVTDDLVLVVDSNVCLQRDTLLRLVAYLEPDVGVVSSLPVAVRPRSIGGRLECAILNNINLPYFLTWSASASRPRSLAAFVLALLKLLMGVTDTGFPIGKCMLYRFREFAAMDGMTLLRHAIFSDLTIAETLRGQGWRTVNTNFLTEHPVGTRSISTTFDRHRRWTVGATRFLHPIVFTDLLGALPTLCLAGAFGASFIGLSPVAAPLITILVFTAGTAMLSSVCGIAMDMTFPLELVAGHLLRFGAIIVGLTRGVRNWRGKPFKLTRATSRDIGHIDH